MTTTQRFNQCFKTQAIGRVVNADSISFLFKTENSAARAASKIGCGFVRRSFTGRWVLILTLSEIESKISKLRAFA